MEDRFGRGRTPRRPGSPALLALILLWLCCLAGPARAAVQISFHSKDFGSTYPHAFVILSGTVDSTGERVQANLGFTVRHRAGPSVLFGAVQGMVQDDLPERYIRASNHHFSMMLTDSEYRSVMALVGRWRTLPQPSYRLDRRNCVTFVAEIAALLGLRAETSGVMRRPRAFLNRVHEANSATIARRGRAGALATR